MIEPGPGTLLIAEPFLKDPNFIRTVVLLCEHDEGGSFGFVLNKVYEHTLDELMNDMEELKISVYYGGPVQMDTIHFLHQYPEQIPGGLEVTDGVYWGGDFETAINLLRSGEIDANKIRFFIGYSGWSTGQLDEEVKEKSWLLAAADQKMIFSVSAADVWKASLKLLGSEYEMMANFPIDPQLN